MSITYRDKKRGRRNYRSNAGNAGEQQRYLRQKNRIPRQDSFNDVTTLQEANSSY